MDEVKAMAAAGEQVGRAVGTGVRAARHAATHAGKVGATASRQAATRAQQELASRGVSAGELREALAEQASHQSERARLCMARNTHAARKELAARIDPGPRRGHRKWPWVLLALAAVGLVTAAVLSRRPEELPASETDTGTPPEQDDNRPWN